MSKPDMTYDGSMSKYLTGWKFECAAALALFGCSITVNLVCVVTYVVTNVVQFPAWLANC